MRSAFQPVNDTKKQGATTGKNPPARLMLGRDWLSGEPGGSGETWGSLEAWSLAPSPDLSENAHKLRLRGKMEKLDCPEPCAAQLFVAHVEVSLAGITQL